MQAGPQVDYIRGPRNPEDLVAVPETPWVIASGLADKNFPQGALYLIDGRTKVWRVLYPTERSVVSGAVDPSHFTAHGLNLRVGKGKIDTLYVVNHAERESIEFFELDASRDLPTIRWTGCAVFPNPVFGNGVAALPDGGFVATAFFLKGDPRLAEKVKAGEPTGYVLEWHPGAGWRKIPGSEGSLPNGVEVSSDGKWLYVANTGNKNVVRLSLGPGSVQKTVIATDFAPDNLRWNTDGKLWLTGQEKSCGTEAICTAPFQILRLDPTTLQAEAFRHAATAPDFGAGTVALQVGAELWVGTYRGDRIACFPNPN
jgi:hypothetical protein